MGQTQALQQQTEGSAQRGDRQKHVPVPSPPSSDLVSFPKSYLALCCCGWPHSGLGCSLGR